MDKIINKYYILSRTVENNVLKVEGVFLISFDAEEYLHKKLINTGFFEKRGDDYLELYDQKLELVKRYSVCVSSERTCAEELKEREKFDEVASKSIKQSYKYLNMCNNTNLIDHCFGK